MMTIKSLVLDHLTYTFEKEAWQPSLTEAIAGLTAAQAAWKPSPQRHSIWQIVRHVILWKQGVLDAWDGKVPSADALEQADWKDASGDEAAWQADVHRLREVSRRMRERAEGFAEADFDRAMPTYQGIKDQVAAVRLVRMATHDIYHAGQIRYIRALQGV